MSSHDELVAMTEDERMVHPSIKFDLPKEECDIYYQRIIDKSEEQIIGEYVDSPSKKE